MVAHQMQSLADNSCKWRIFTSEISLFPKQNREKFVSFCCKFKQNLHIETLSGACQRTFFEIIHVHFRNMDNRSELCIRKN